jgi:hypothetical protein
MIEERSIQPAASVAYYTHSVQNLLANPVEVDEAERRLRLREKWFGSASYPRKPSDEVEEFRRKYIERKKASGGL